MNVVAVTPTRNRPQQLELCRRYVARQTFPVLEHVVAQGDTELGGNLYSALADVPPEADIVVIFEDDDWYSPHYVQRVVEQFERHPRLNMLGWGSLGYYRWPDRTYNIHRTRGCALCATSFRVEKIRRVQDWCFWEPAHLDTRLWNDINGMWPAERFGFDMRAVQEAKRLGKTPEVEPLVLGMKGLGGGGYGRAHAGKDKFLNQTDDEERSWLASVIGEEDLAEYVARFSPSPESASSAEDPAASPR